MLYFSPPTSNTDVHTAMLNGELGFIKTPAQGNRLFDDVAWCADNGCFGKGYPGDEKWLAWLAKHHYAVERCWFATAPDVVGGGADSLERSLPWLPRIREVGFPAALVAQDGFEDIKIPWDEFDVLFIGGEKTDKPADEWKLSPAAREITREAKRRGKRVHMGRVSSKKRWDIAMSWGCDSVDGTFIKFGPYKNLPITLSWCRPFYNPYLTWNGDEFGDA